MRRIFQARIVKILSIVILVWIVSAVYSYHISSKSGDSKYAFAGSTTNESNVMSLVWDNFTPTNLKLAARAAIVVDAATGKVLFAKNQDTQQPIASLTKLATALVFLECNPDLNGTVTITAADKQGAGRTKFFTGETLTLKDCLHMCLMRSDNVAARALARSTGYSMEKFVYLMNNLAYRLGLEHTAFVDPTGLFAGNMSTAADYVKLARKAFENPTIGDITSKRNYQFRPLNKKITHTLYNTNRLLFSNHNINGGKTGYISQAGYCLALNAVDNSGRPITAILLGAPSNSRRYKDASTLMTYAMNN
jgi:serine-type D-Ala-D-Ala endopeptidase (penicillin-binding protein 7)